MPVIQILTPEGSRVIKLPEGSATIGRSHDNDVVIDDSRSSRKHCLLRPGVGGYSVQDLGSRNGTKYNGQQITEVQIRFGEAFSIGRTILRIFEKQAPSVELVDSTDTVDERVAKAPVATLIESDDVDATLAWRDGPDGQRSQAEANERGVTNRYGMVCKRIY